MNATQFEIERQMITSSITYGLPDIDFWNSYSQLWLASTNKSPFQAPYFLQFLATQTKGKLAIFSAYQNGQLIAAGIFFQEKNQYQWLSQLKSDDNQLVVHQELSNADLLLVFQDFLNHTAKEQWNIIWDRLPEQGQYDNLISILGQTSSQRWIDHPGAACPVMSAESPDAFLEKVMRSKRLRRNYRSIKRREGAEIEVLENDTDLDTWVKEFSHWHTVRWQGNQATSSYASPERQAFLTGCLRAWVKDGILVRTAIKFDGHRVSLNIGLRLANGLLGHGQAYDASYNTLSLGRSLILFIGEWMAEQDMSYFNFGEGTDPYKMAFTDTSIPNRRLYIAPSWNLAFLGKAKLRKVVKENPKLLDFYRKKVQPHIGV